MIYHLAPPLFAKKDSETGHLKKAEYGPWMGKAFAKLAKFKFLRGTALDIFGYTQERKDERKMIAHFQGTLSYVVEHLNSGNMGVALELFELPMKVRGYGHVKEKAMAQYYAEHDHLMALFNNPTKQPKAAE